MRLISIEEIEEALAICLPKRRGVVPYIWGIPRGGQIIACLAHVKGWGQLVTTPEQADIIIDDVVDSGKTLVKYIEKYPTKKIISLFHRKPDDPFFVFPWEDTKEKDGEDLITRILQMIGENPKREGLLDTPKRVVKSWTELYSGYSQEPKEVLSTIFKSDNDAMVICKGIEFYSTCEHHMIPFFGTVSIGYLPKGHVVGLSKLARLVDCFSRRLQIQEQLAHQLANAIAIHIPEVLGAGVVVTAKHLCMCGRGVSKQGSEMVTSAMTGKFLSDSMVRSEFLSLIK